MSHLPKAALLIALSRVGFGTLSLLFPTQILTLFRMRSTAPPGPDDILPTRLFGVREAVFGALLYNARTPQSLRQLLIAGVVIDGFDAVSTIVGWEQGNVGRDGALLLGGAAVALVGLGALGLRSPLAAVRAVQI